MSWAELAFSEQSRHHCLNPLQQEPWPAEVLSVLAPLLAWLANKVPALLQSCFRSLRTSSDSSTSFYNHFGWLPVFFVQLRMAYTKKKAGSMKLNRCISERNCFTPSLLLFWPFRHSLRDNFVDFMALYLALWSASNTKPLMKSAVKEGKHFVLLPFVDKEAFINNHHVRVWYIITRLGDHFFHDNEKLLSFLPLFLALYGSLNHL